MHVPEQPYLQKIDLSQGDQIGRIFAQWPIVYFEQCFENYKSSPNYSATFCINFDINGLGRMLGAFSTYSSGHPDLSHPDTHNVLYFLRFSLYISNCLTGVRVIKMKPDTKWKTNLKK
jgi:hypothetical protein